MEIDHKSAKEQCAMDIKGVCAQCGNMVEPLEVVHGPRNPTYWNGCTKCQRYTDGVDPKVYRIAERMVRDKGFKYFKGVVDRESDSFEDKEYKTRHQISGTCYIISDVLELIKDDERKWNESKDEG